jgi:uncharacterized membrane protein YqjE
MIQRVQTIWLALAAAAGFTMSSAPLFVATLTNQTKRTFLATESLLSFALIIAVACMALVAIFLYKNRTLQFKLTVTGILLSIGVIGLQVWAIDGFKKSTPILSGTYQWGGLLPVAMVIFLFLAARGIRKDQKLMNSLDRLR